MATFISHPGEFPQTADVIIIGGGPAGAATLWALDQLDPTARVVLIERSDTLGAGSSGASLECFRSCFPTTCLAEQMKRSITVYENAAEYFGEDAAAGINVRLNGYLFCAFTAQQAAGLQADVTRLHQIGLKHIEYLDRAAVAQRFPWAGRNVIAAKFDPKAGWLESHALIYAYARSSSRGTVLLGAGDIQICAEGDRVTGVQTAHGRISAPQVIIAAGAWSGALAQQVGITLPVVIRPRQSFTTAWRSEDIPSHSPMIISSAPHPHLRPEAREGAIFGWEYAHHQDWDAPVDALERWKDPRFPSLTLALMARQFGHQPGEGFNDARYLRGVRHNIGYYVYRNGNSAFRTTADGIKQPYESERAIIDAHAAVGGLYVSIAHGGHGIMTSAAAGEIMAALVLGQSFTHPSFADFGIAVGWVEHDESVL